MSPDPPLPAVDYTDTCSRPPWHQLPSAVRGAVDRAAGSPVVRAAEPVRSGFTGGFAAVLELRDGRQVFGKAGSSRNSHLPAAYAQEARVMQALPPDCPAPAFVGAAHLPAGEADEHEWRIVVAQAVDGRIPQPWTEASLAAVHQACSTVARVLAPLSGSFDFDVTPLAQDYGQDPGILGSFPGLADGSLALTGGQPGWLPSRLDELAELVLLAPEALAGDVPCHNDLRADNVLVTAAGQAVLVDWNWLGTGPAWVDFVALLPLARADGVDADAWVRRSPLTRDADPQHVDSWLAVIAGYMLSHADAPVWPGGPPSVRQHQRRYARTFLDWLAARRGWVR